MFCLSRKSHKAKIVQNRQQLLATEIGAEMDGDLAQLIFCPDHNIYLSRQAHTASESYRFALAKISKSFAKSR